MLVRLLYASRVAESVDAEEVAEILKAAKARNAKSGVTGVLCWCQASGVFMQVLEGGREPVSALYNRIAADPRHRDLVLLAYREIAERHFAGWAMGLVNMARLNAALLLKYSETATLDPYAVPGAVSMALFEELVATASVVGQG